MGATVELAAAGFQVTEPVVDAALPGGAGHLIADRSHAILRIPGVGTFAIAEGVQVRFDPEPTVPEGALSMWLHGTVAAILLAQRGRFALHASVVSVDGVGVAVAGPRYAGKSTTALRLMQLGHPLVTDDVSPVLLDDKVTVHPFTRPIHVLSDTAESLGLDVSGARSVLPEHPKLALPTGQREPVELGAIAVLQPSDANATVYAERVSGAQAHWQIALNTYRSDVLRQLWQGELFAWAAALAAKVPLYVVTRPESGWTVDAVAQTIEGISRTRTAT